MSLSRALLEAITTAGYRPIAPDWLLINYISSLPHETAYTTSRAPNSNNTGALRLHYAVKKPYLSGSVLLHKLSEPFRRIVEDAVTHRGLSALYDDDLHAGHTVVATTLKDGPAPRQAGQLIPEPDRPPPSPNPAIDHDDFEHFEERCYLAIAGMCSCSSCVGTP